MAKMVFLVFLAASFFPAVTMAGANESFGEFISQFLTSKDFQISRIQFPLESLVGELGDDGEWVQTKNHLLRSEWEFTDFGYYDQSLAPQVYDNFEKKLRDTGERLLEFKGTESGILFYLYFERIKGKWYLVKMVDDSM
jgi:hypothetical protein